MSDEVLVTGGTGFIGTAVTAALRKAGREAIPLGRSDGDIASAETLSPHRAKGISSVIHCAGRTFVPDSWDDPAGFMTVNLLGTLRVLEFCRAESARLIHLSAYIYGQPEKLPIAESAPVRANNPYALSKQLAEQACRFHAEQFGVPITILRPFNVYGPGQARQFLIPTILAQLHGTKVKILDLEPRRDYVFLPDLVDAILRAEMLTAPGYRIVNIGSGQSVSVAEIVAAAQVAAGTSLKVVSRKKRRSNEIPDVVADITAARDLLDWSPRNGLAEGLKECWRAHVAGLEQTT
jgi:nucleoside-diphosphate-sugar epimerase